MHETVEIRESETPRAHFSPAEIRAVLAGYPMSGVRAMRELIGGDPASPKVYLETEVGRCVLKRHAPPVGFALSSLGAHAFASRVAASASAQEAAAARGVPTPGIFRPLGGPGPVLLRDKALE